MVKVVKKERIIPRLERVTEAELKLKYIKGIYAERISDDEIANSDVWCIFKNDGNDVFGIFMLQRKSIFESDSACSIRITHMSIPPDILNQVAFLKIYIELEEYYVNNNVNNFSVALPKIRGFTKKAVNFFKFVGFKYYEYSSFETMETENEVLVFLLKNDLVKNYKMVDGKYKVNMRLLFSA